MIISFSCSHGELYIRSKQNNMTVILLCRTFFFTMYLNIFERTCSGILDQSVYFYMVAYVPVKSLRGFSSSSSRLNEVERRPAGPTKKEQSQVGSRPSGVGKGRRHDGRSARFRQNVARFRLYRRRFLQENTRFAAFFKIYQISS